MLDVNVKEREKRIAKNVKMEIGKDTYNDR
jgi:hypothetical protein